jgi:PPOX class probable F420-dependent enzyme
VNLTTQTAGSVSPDTRSGRRFGPMALTFSDVAGSEYILLTTFTKDGRPKPTAIWAVADGDRLIAITQEQSWKVKRIRNTPRVTIATCDRSGKPKGEAVEATAAILDKSANGATYDAIGKRYGLLGKTFNLFSKLRGGMEKNVTIELKAAV